MLSSTVVREAIKRCDKSSKNRSKLCDKCPLWDTEFVADCLCELIEVTITDPEDPDYNQQVMLAELEDKFCNSLYEDLKKVKEAADE